MPKSILIVDDEVVIADISRRKLEERGYEAMVAHNGEEALGQLSVRMPDLIILDVQMPDMNGYTFMLEKDKNPAFVNIPVIVVTATHETEPLFKRHHVAAYLMKPMKLHDLVDKVVEILGPA